MFSFESLQLQSLHPKRSERSLILIHIYLYLASVWQLILYFTKMVTFLIVREVPRAIE